MLKTVIKIAVRNMKRNRFYTFINVFGLALGLACCIIIFMFIKFELSYDRFHPDAKRTFRANSHVRLGGQQNTIPLTSRLLAPALQEKFPEISNSLRVESKQPNIVVYKEGRREKVIKEDFLLNADAHFFEFFHFPLLIGNPSQALEDSSSIVLTESRARKIFGQSWKLNDLIGKTLLVGEQRKAFRISGIAEDAPENSHIHFGMIVPTHSVEDYEESRWASFQTYTYFKIQEGLENEQGLIKDLENRLELFVQQQTEGDLKELTDSSMEEFLAEGNSLDIRIIPIQDIHLKSRLPDEIVPGGNILYIYLFGASSFFIVILACVNFMNLATARSAGRAKEVGVRKVLGSQKKYLILQFLMEGVLYSLLALLLAFALVELAMPFFSRISGRMLGPSYADPVLLTFSLLLSVFVGLLSGSYPAFYLTRFEPAQVLKGQMVLGNRSGKLRSFLVVFQFSVSIILIVGTLLVHQQLSYLQNQPLGFDKHNLLVIKNTANLGDRSRDFKKAVKALPGVKSAAFSSNMPGDYTMNASSFRMADKTLGTTISVLWADQDYLETLGAELLNGRGMKGWPADTNSIIVNQAAVRYFKEKEAVDQQIEVFVKPSPSFKVVGVVKDFNFKSLDNQISPLGIFLSETGDLLSVRLGENPLEQLKAIEAVWQDMLPGVPFEYYFVEQRFDELNHLEEQMSHIMAIFTFMAIIIACLGLFGLAAFTAEQRRKEIGVRKVFGSSEREVVMLLSKEYLKLVIIAFLIATPLAYFAMDFWLDNFAYRISIGFGAFFLSGALAMLIAFATVGFQSLKAAWANPVDSLKEE